MFAFSFWCTKEKSLEEEVLDPPLAPDFRFIPWLYIFVSTFGIFSSSPAALDTETFVPLLSAALPLKSQEILGEEESFLVCASDLFFFSFW